MLLGIYGFIGSGKGTVGDILVEKYGYTREAFANPVKDAVSSIFGWPRHLLEGDTEESRKFRESADPKWSALFQRPFTPREALQLMGTEAGRNVYHKDLWLYALGVRLGVYGASHVLGNIVITDVRFPNEIGYIRSLGGRVMRVRRGAEPDYWDTAMDDKFLGEENMKVRFPHVHYSEYAWIGCAPDYLIENDSDIETLEKRVVEALKLGV